MTYFATFREMRLNSFLLYFKIKQKCINCYKNTLVTHGFYKSQLVLLA